MQVLVLQTQGLRGRDRRARRVRTCLRAVLKVLRERRLALELLVDGLAARLVSGPALQLLLEVFRAEDRDLCEQELARDHFGFCVVEHGPYGNL